MKREFSAGGIVFKGSGKDLQFILVRNYKADRDVNYWGFPKGHLEEGETSKEAALREVKEETGVEAEITEKVDKIEYFFKWQGEKVFKVVTFFLMKYVAGEVQFQASELAEADWFSPDDALKTISFENEKKLFQKALEILDGE
jgi:8-oxo-dGTP diphosphatase